MTGFITRILFVTNTTEPLNLIIGPLLYLFIKRSLDQSRSKKEWLHFIPAILYFGYIFIDFLQPAGFKYNSYVNSFHPDWQMVDVQLTYPTDPLGIKKYLNIITAGQISFYITLALLKLEKRARIAGTSVFKTDDDMLTSLRNMVFHILAIIIIFIIVKINFEGDLGDYFIGIYVSLFVMITTFRVMNDSTYFDRSASFMDISIGKYRKSSLNEPAWADMTGWEELAGYVAKAYYSLSDEEKKICTIYGERNYGYAGAVYFYGKQYDLPEAITFHESYVFWAPDSIPNGPIIYIYRDINDLKDYFADISVAGSVDDPWFREKGLKVFLCREPLTDVSKVYRELAVREKSRFTR